MTHETGANVVKLVIIGLSIQLLVILFVLYSSYEGRVRLVESQQRGCERGKLDRADNAAFQRAHTIYITKVTGAKSVKQDVKDAAEIAVITFRRTSANLAARSKIDCETAFPKASFLP